MFLKYYLYYLTEMYIFLQRKHAVDAGKKKKKKKAEGKGTVKEPAVHQQQHQGA